MGYSAMIGASFLSVLGETSLVGVLTGHFSDIMVRNKVLVITILFVVVPF
jgi:hypothetical protein